MGGIYIITIGRYFYVGRTSNFTKRKSKHIRDLEKGIHTNKIMRDVFSKYGREGFIFNKVFKIKDRQLMIEIEQKMLDKVIKYRNCMNYNPSATNGIMYGADNHLSKAVVQLDKDGETIKEYESAHMANKDGFHHNSIIKCCKNIKGYYSHKGYYWMYRDEYYKNGFDISRYSKAEKHKRSVIQLDRDGNFIKRFDKIVDVAKDGFEPKNISPVCMGKRKTHKGYKWIYEEDYLADKM